MSAAARPKKLLTQEQVCEELEISSSTWWRWRQAKKTPEPVTMPSGRLKWRRADIEAILEAPETPRRRYFTSVYRSA